MTGEKSGVMSHRPAHWRSTRSLESEGISSSTWPASSSQNASEPRIEYEATESVLAPNTSSPRSVWLTYTCSVPETTTVLRNGLTGSVTAASSGCVMIGSVTPAIAEISDDQPAVQFTTSGVDAATRRGDADDLAADRSMSS